jgi:phosphatidylinositol glycan class A protein
MECLFHARTMGLHVVYTDHSLFGFDDLACVNLNKVIKCFFTDVDQTISVSNIGRDNLILRIMVHPSRCNVIPNGIDFTKFLPTKDEDRSKDTINIVSISRQTYRKGTDLLIEIIPELCKKYPNVRFLIGGDGPKKVLLDNMIQASNLHDQVKLFGALPHSKVRDVMAQGHIYINTSLTEAFCIAIVEAASTGLYVIATDVGGVGEVLPEEMITLVESKQKEIIKGVEYAINNYDKIKNGTFKYYDRLKYTYNWDKVGRKTVSKIMYLIKNLAKSV